MKSLLAPENRRIAAALAASLLLHLVVLVVRSTMSDSADRHGANRVSSRVDAVLAKPRAKVDHPAQPAPSQPRRPRPLMTKPKAEPNETVATVPVPEKTWSQAERQEMDQFLKELDAEAQPRTGQQLAQRAVQTARTIAAASNPDDDEIKEMTQKLASAGVDRFTLEMYFDAVYRKMNRSAAMVRHEPHRQGARVAAVRIIVARDGSVKDFRILWAADQQAEIDYIRAVVARAAPFPVFPEDIRNATDTIVLQVCIQPGRYADGSGATFSRMAKGQVCREAD